MTKKILKKLFIILSLFLILIGMHPQSSFAQGDAGVTAAVGMLPYIQPIMSFFWGIITQLVQGGVYLIVATFLLQITIDNSSTWIDINSNFVQTGLSITTGLADILLIIVFIAIAIGYVFKIETFKSEKSIPKFFITAILIHFAPLFVGMTTDIANVIVKGIMIGKEGIFTDTFLSYDFGGKIMLSVVALGSSFVTAAGASGASWLGLAATAGAILLGVSNLLVGVPVYLTQVMTLNIISGIIFSYAIFFLTRVFIIQILTILSPLAILSGALPQTSKWFDMWKEWLLGWAFGGILVLFLLTLGLTCLEMLGSLPPNSTASAGIGTEIINLNMNWSFPWLALAVYMMTVEALCLAAIPSLAKDFTTKVKEGSAGLKKAGSPIAKGIQGRIENKGLLEKPQQQQKQQSTS